MSIKAPFTDIEVSALNRWQVSDMVHPFTCPNRGDGRHKEVGNDLGVLVAKNTGWVCLYCDYTQEWAHACMLEPPPNIQDVFGKPMKAERLKIKDPLTRKPDISGPHGRAWLVNGEAARIKAGVAPEQVAQIAAWVIEAPWAHLAWHSYWLCLTHLRPMPDVRDTIVYLDGGTHELVLYAMDPQKRRDDVLDGDNPFPALLSPCNFAAQIIEPGDAEAVMRISETVQDICNGVISPDTDFIRVWGLRFGDNMMKEKLK